ncbi:MAG: PorT family protein [Prevotellaceae bacterium]|jgi:hypothetical protein|nr:PorT family protein [Prevotellaceae bacterium]
MKHIFFFVIVASCLLFANNSQAQIFRFGIKAGATFSKFNWSSNVGNMIDNNSATGFQVGVMTRVKIPIIGLAVHPELLYTTSGSDSDKFGYFQIPVNLQWGIDLKVVRPFVQGGPYWGYAVKKSSKRDNWDDINRSNWGIGLGAGIEILNHLQVAFKYDWGLTDLSDNSSVSFKNRVFNLSIGYLF